MTINQCERISKQLIRELIKGKTMAFKRFERFNSARSLGYVGRLITNKCYNF